MRQVVRYESDDGEVWETQQEAVQHELETLMFETIAPNVNSAQEALFEVLNHADEIYRIMSQGAGTVNERVSAAPTPEFTPVVNPLPRVLQAQQVVDPEVVMTERERHLDDETNDAVLSTAFSHDEWLSSIRYLVDKGLDDRHIVGLLRSETPRWAEKLAMEQDIDPREAIGTYLERNPHLLQPDALENFAQNFVD